MIAALAVVMALLGVSLGISINEDNAGTGYPVLLAIILLAAVTVGMVMSR
jgi:hypothetical protein